MKPSRLPAWKREVEDVLRTLPGGYNPWDQAAGVGAWLDHRAALEAINWFADHLHHVEGAAKGEPFILSRWQAAVVGNLFGWKRHDEKGRTVRRYRKMLLYVARGNGKTPLAAGIILYAFYQDGEPGSQCYLAAGSREQAGYLFRNAAGFVDQDESLSARTTIYGRRGGSQVKSLVQRDDPFSFCKIIPAEAAGQHGGIPHAIGLDELHVQESRDLLDVFETGMAKLTRAQPLLVMITTADYDRPESTCNQVYATACRVRDNGGDPAKPGFDPTFLPVIYEIGQDSDWTDESLWGRANPNLGVSVSLEELRNMCRTAQEDPLKENEFRRLNLNQRTKQDVRIIAPAAWAACGVADLSPPITSPAELIGRECFAGIDLASTDDLASASFAFPLPDDWLAVLSFSWCPADRIIKRARQKFPYDVWAKLGYGVEGWPKFLTATEGDGIDHRFIRTAFNELGQVFTIREVGYDPHGASQMQFDLIDDGFDVTPITQKFGALAGPTKELIRRVRKRRIIHFGNPVLAWAIGNATVHFDGRLPAGGKIEEHLDKVPIMLSKRKSTDKIDPAAALVLAMVRMGTHPQENEERVVASAI